MSSKNLKLRAKIVERFGLISDFAEEVGDDVSIVSKVINNRLKISTERAAKWSNLLGADVREMFDGPADR
jgi:plasmid maintenance system antidote protein VapI